MSKSSGSSAILKPVPGYPRECDYCFPKLEFYDPSEFGRHLRTVHASKEGGSFVCRYGDNNVCQSLPPEGVSDVDYEAHIRKCHANGSTLLSSPVPSSSEAETEENKFTINSFAQNLSSVLSDPKRKRTEVANFFTRHWGDSFTCPSSVPPSPDLPRVGADKFVTYIRSTGKNYQQYRAQKNALSTQKHLAEKCEGADDLPHIFVDPSFRLSHGPTFSSIFLAPPEGGDDVLRLPLGSERSNNSPVEKPGSFRDYKVLHCRLDRMHDIVDSRLAVKLVSKSDDFWGIVHSYGSLNDDLAAAMSEVKTVRSRLNLVSSSIYERSKKILELHRLRDHKAKLLSKLKDISCIRDAQSSVQMMLNQSDYPKAVECIDMTQEVLESELSGVHCFRYLGIQLEELYSAIGRMMHEDFVQVVQKEFGAKSDDSQSLQFEGELSAVLIGLIHVKKYTFVNVIRTEIQQAVKNILRQIIKIRFVDCGLDLSKFDPSLGDLTLLREMHFSDWLKTISIVTDALIGFCLRLRVFQKLMCECLDHVTRSQTHLKAAEALTVPEARHELSSPEEEHARITTATSDPAALMGAEIRSEYHLRRVISVVVDFANTICQQQLVRVLQGREQELSENSHLISPAEFSEEMKLIKAYLLRCLEEGWTRCQISSPLGIHLDKMIIDFVELFHNQRRLLISKLLDSELWRSSEVNSSYQKIVDDCVDSGKLRDVASSSKDSSSSDVLLVNGEQFVVVSSALEFVRILANYCECIEYLPMQSPTLLSKVIDLLKLFNSRTCQLILGAGALQLVGLKTISVRNLGLSFRSLQLVMKFIPYVSNELEQNFSEDQAHLMRHFKQVLSDYNDHLNEITNKLASVIEHHTVSCLSTWEVKGTTPTAAFQLICKKMQKFHDALVGVMPVDDIKRLFILVHDNFKANLKVQVAKIGITPHDALTYGLVCQDYAYYTQSLQSMECCSDLYIESLNEILYSR